MKQKQLKCPYCGAMAFCRPASVVYGSSNRHNDSYLYICSRWPACNAYVGTHKRNRKPLGSLANSELRHKRILAHRTLADFQQQRHMKKWEAYIWLQAKLGLNESQTHIGMFSEYMCDQTISVCRQALTLPHIRAA